MTGMNQRLPASITLVRSLPGVDTAMKGQFTTVTERLPANITLVWFLSGVDTVMIVQMTPSKERLPANITFVPSFVTILHVFVQTMLFQTLEIAMQTARSGTDTWEQSGQMCIIRSVLMPSIPWTTSAE